MAAAYYGLATIFCYVLLVLLPTDIPRLDLKERTTDSDSSCYLPSSDQVSLFA